MSDEPQLGSQIVLYQGSPLERIAVNSFLPHDRLVDLFHPRFFIPNEVVIGEYGVTGFVVIDSRPEKRWESYTDPDLFGVYHTLENHCGHLPSEPKKDPLRLAHYVNTDKGFKMIRYFLLPLKVHDLFRSDEDIGEGLIAKCCKADIPKWLDEEYALLVFGNYSTEEEGSRFMDSFKDSLAQKLGVIAKPNQYRYGFRDEHYLSFHPWQFLTNVIQIGEASIVMAIGAFDSMLNKLDREGKLRKRDISTKDAIEYIPAVPQHLYQPPLST